MNIKKDFPIFQNRKNLIYFDNASTTQKPKSVIDTTIDYYTNYNANIHRGAYSISEKATYEFEKARSEIAQFIKSANEEIIFTSPGKDIIKKPGASNYILGTEIKRGSLIINFDFELSSKTIGFFRFFF